LILYKIKNIKKLFDLPTQELKNEFKFEKFEDIPNSIKTNKN